LTSHSVITGGLFLAAIDCEMLLSLIEHRFFTSIADAEDNFCRRLGAVRNDKPALLNAASIRIALAESRA
jgi:hypothetical protein